MITKKDLVKDMADTTGMTHAAMDRALTALFTSIQQHVIDGESVRLDGIGVFEMRKTGARKFKHPISGEIGIIPAHKAPRFKPSKVLKDIVRSAK